MHLYARQDFSKVTYSGRSKTCCNWFARQSVFFAVESTLQWRSVTYYYGQNNYLQRAICHHLGCLLKCDFWKWHILYERGASPPYHQRTADPAPDPVPTPSYLGDPLFVYASLILRLFNMSLLFVYLQAESNAVRVYRFPTIPWYKVCLKSTLYRRVNQFCCCSNNLCRAFRLTKNCRHRGLVSLTGFINKNDVFVRNLFLEIDGLKVFVNINQLCVVIIVMFSLRSQFIDLKGRSAGRDRVGHVLNHTNLQTNIFLLFKIYNKRKCSCK